LTVSMQNNTGQIIFDVVTLLTDLHTMISSWTLTFLLFWFLAVLVQL
jgi:hypothetical protein